MGSQAPKKNEVGLLAGSRSESGVGSISGVQPASHVAKDAMLPMDAMLPRRWCVSRKSCTSLVAPAVARMSAGASTCQNNHAYTGRIERLRVAEYQTQLCRLEGRAYYIWRPQPEAILLL